MKKEKAFDLFYENSVKAKELNDQYDHEFQQLIKYISRHQKDIVKANVILSYCLDSMLEHQEKFNDAKQCIGKNHKEFINKIEKTIHMKDEIAKIKKSDSEKYMISGLYMTICAYLILLFIKELITQNYLINFSIDLIVAVIAMVICFKGISTHWKLINRFHLERKPFIMEVVGFAAGLFIVIMTIKSPFDISFLILVISHFVSQKMFTNLLMK